MRVSFNAAEFELKRALSERGFGDAMVMLIPIEPPRDWGITTNACFLLGKRAAGDEIERQTEGLNKKEAKQVAGKLAREAGEKLAAEVAAELNGLAGEKLPFISRVESEGAYINFYYDAPALGGHVVEEVLRTRDHYGKGAPTGKRIMVEYAQPNTHKDFHVGHLRNASIGQAIANLLEQDGNDVLKATYIGDIGRHVAIALWASRNLWTRKYEFLLDKLQELGLAKSGSSAIEDIRALMSLGDNLDYHQNPRKNIPWGNFYNAGSRFINLLSQAYLEAVSEKVKNEEWDKYSQWLYGFISFFEAQIRNEISEWLREWEYYTEEVEDSSDKKTPPPPWMERHFYSADIEWHNSVVDCLNEINAIFDELSIHPDLEYSFSEYKVEKLKLGQKAASELKQHGIAIVDDSREYKGALYVDFEQQSNALRPDGTPVFSDDEKKRVRKLGKMTILRSDGTSLYQTKELGLAKHKFDMVKEKYGSPLSESLYVVGAEQKLYFEQVFAILRLWGFPNADHCRHIAYELVVLPEGKMSSREGTIVSYRELRDEAVRRAEEVTREKGIGAAGEGGAIDEDKVQRIAHDVAIAAIKFAMLQVTGSQKIVFDFESALSFSGRAAPYLQYAYARAGKLVDESVEAHAGEPGYDLHESEVELARVISQFPSVCREAAAACEPATLCTYLYSLANSFSAFYRDCRVLDADEPMKSFRTGLTRSFRQVMRTGFAVLALPLPEEM